MISTRHQCMIYEGSPVENLKRLVPIISRKLEERHRCMFFGPAPVVDGMQKELEAAGIKVTEMIRRGALVFVSDQSHLKDGVFDTELMLTMLGQAVRQALLDGYRGLWATGDMTWEFGPEKNLPKLLAYERALEKMFHTLPGLSGVCQYHKDTLPLSTLKDALDAHPMVFINHTLQRVNPFYIPPEAEGSGPVSADVSPSVIEAMVLQVNESAA